MWECGYILNNLVKPNYTFQPRNTEQYMLYWECGCSFYSTTNMIKVKCRTNRENERYK